MPKRIVSTDFWTDGKVVDMFSAEDKYFMLYLLTNPHSTQLGIYRLNPRIAAFELGYSIENVKVLLDRFENTYNVIKWADNEQEIAIKNFLCYSIVAGGKPIYDQLTRELKQVKNKKLVSYVFDNLKNKENINATVLAFVNNNTSNDNNANANANADALSYHETGTNRQRIVIDNEKVAEIMDFWNTNVKPITEFEYQELQELYKETGYANVMEAMKRACRSNKRNINYVRKVSTELANGNDYYNKSVEQEDKNKTKLSEKELENYKRLEEKFKRLHESGQ